MLHADRVLPYLRPVFIEHQRSRGRAHWIGMGILVIFNLWVFGVMYHTSQSHVPLVFATLVFAALGAAFAFFASPMITRVDADGVHLRWFPWRRLTIPHRRIVSVGVETYDAMNEFGGWGIKGPPGRWGWCYTVSGNAGVRVELENRDRLLIGSQRAHELAEAIRSAPQG